MLMTSTTDLPQTGALRFACRLLSIAAAATMVSCGFAPQPKSGTVACKPSGGACCPSGYLCVGRGLNTAGGASAGTCWSQVDLPLDAGAATHDYTPTIAGDSACLVTDWLPPELVGIGMAPDAGFVDPRAPAVAGRADAGPGTDGGTPVTPVVPVASASIVAGGGRTYLLTNNKLLGWGENDSGELGDGTTTNRVHPVQVLGLESGVTNFAVGGYHACAVVNGGVKCWGWAAYGSLGDGSTLNGSRVPISVINVTKDATAVAVGFTHTCAVVKGGVQCWGRNDCGQLGDGTTVDSLSPVKVKGLTSGVAAIAAGSAHVCALVGNRVQCWGNNDSGQLGDGTLQVRETPVGVIGLESATAIAAGYDFTCATVVSGALRCWGANSRGELGNGTTTSSPVPVEPLGLSANVTQVACGGSHACAVVNGGARCWGWNWSAQLGADFMEEKSTTPLQVVGLTSGVQGVAAGSDHSCARMADGVKCWGSNTVCQLGVPSPFCEISTGGVAYSRTPVDVQFL
jgi:alpha-tubulin suppressor-like RCC1 family protein